MKNIFDNIESEKRVELNDRIWQRVEDKLDVNKYKTKSTNYKWIAACALLVVAVGFIFKNQSYPNRSKYRVTDFSIDSGDGFIQNTDDRTTLKKWYDELIDCTIKRDKYSC